MCDISRTSNIERITASDKQLCVLFDWGDTLMRVFPEYSGPMVEWPEVAALPLAAQVLAELHPHCLLALATNARDSQEDQIWAALDRAELSIHLDKIYCFKNIGQVKPTRQFYEYIIKDLKLPADQVIMVGDDWQADVLGANQAGLRAIWLNTHSPEQRSGPQFQTIHSLAGLVEALRSWNFLT
jgi:putative hydrolase of the HAD superfamily